MSRMVNAVGRDIEIDAHRREIWRKTPDWAGPRPLYTVRIVGFDFLLGRAKIISGCARIFFLTTPHLLLYSMIPVYSEEFQGGVLL
jgi:hypothetical protein